MPDTLCLGLISGTSADGIDAALARIAREGNAVRLDPIAFVSPPYPADVRAELLALNEQTDRAVARLCSLNAVVGELFAEAALQVCREAGIDPGQLHVVGSHGQTVWHQPEPDPALPITTPATLQIGAPAIIAARLGAPVVADFRTADMAAGGQGAPLAPYFDWALLRHLTRTRAALNLGGIGNVTLLLPGGGPETVRAFDTGPGNILIDGLASLLTAGAAAVDRDGALAAQGRIDDALLADLLADPYFDQPPPKTTGRERYGAPYWREILANADIPQAALTANAPEATRQRGLDLLATVTALTARSIAAAIHRWLPAVEEVVVSGGGARNPTLMGMLRSALAPVTLTPLDTIGYDGDAKEALLIALLAHDALLSLPTNVPAATGARRAVTLGSLTPPAFGP